MAADQPSTKNRKPLAADEVVIHVPKGQGKNVRVVESPDAGTSAEITVQVSKNRKASRAPVLGVIVK